MEEAIEIIKDGATPRNLGIMVVGTQKMGNGLAEIFDHYINKNPKHSEKYQTMNKNTNKQTNNLDNNETVMEVEEGIETTYDRLDKLINEKTSPSDKERAINNKNNDNNRKQNTKEAWNILEKYF